MTPEEKLEKVEELLAERDEITSQLLVLMGAPEDDEDEEEEDHEIKPKRGRPAKEKTIAVGTQNARAPRQPCDECGSAGTRHFKTCSKAVPVGGSPKEKGAKPIEEKPTGGTILDEPLRLTREQFDEIRSQSIDGLTAEMIGFSYPNFEFAEIQRAIRSDNYAFYLK